MIHFDKYCSDGLVQPPAMAGCPWLEAFPLMSLRKNPPSPVGSRSPMMEAGCFGASESRTWETEPKGWEMAVHNELGKAALFRMPVLAVWNPWEMNPKCYFGGKSPRVLRSSLPKKPQFQPKKKSDLNFGLCFLTFVPKVDVLNKQIGPRWKLPVHCDIVD